MKVPKEQIILVESKTGHKTTHRHNTVLAECDAGVYVGNTEAGVTRQDTIRLIKESD